ncbi:MAG TPA: hypothetical protein VFV58_37835 [Blastocatellia bacterium]|jgi:hypothetical protein|nr:hypothetical protein [Blastocatellia bacterium]
MFDHLPRAARVFFDKGRNRVERVEKKVRMKLRFQIEQARFGQPLFPSPLKGKSLAVDNNC